MAMKEQSFVLKRGEGLHDKKLIKHTVLHVESPRASTVDSTGVALKNGKPIMKTSYVSPMARARQLAKQRREAAAGSDSTGASKDWDESLPSSSSPSNSESAVSSVAGTPSVSKPSVQRLIPSSGHIPKSGYIPKSGTVYGEETSGSGRLPKFGVWDNNNNNNDDNGPCYTLLFENVAQEKRIGGRFGFTRNGRARPHEVKICITTIRQVLKPPEKLDSTTVCFAASWEAKASV